jgi:hypothetical protein
MSTRKLTIIALAFLLGLLAVGSGCTTAGTPLADAESLAQEGDAAGIRLTASDARSLLFFGHSVAISGDTIVVGAIGRATTIDQNTEWEPVAGAAYVFQKTGATWVEQAKLTAGDVEVGDGFGYAVAIDGNTVVVGARFKNDAVGGNGAGAAYVFQRQGKAWTQQAKLTANDGAPFDLFGHAVAISGDTVVIGARSADDPAGGRNSGAVYVFQREGETWVQQARLTASDAGAVDHFGHAVVISGDTMMVGAFGHDDPHGGRNAGAVYVFQRQGTTWVEQAKLAASDARANAQFGYALAMSGNTLAVGANQDSDALADDDALWFSEEVSGAVYVFQRKGETWTEQAKLTPGDAEEYGLFGETIAIGHTASGDVVAVGGTWIQAVHLFQRSGATWIEVSKLARGEVHGWGGPGGSVAIGGDTVVVGAKWYAEQGISASGAAYVYGLRSALAQPAATRTPEPTTTPPPVPTLSVQETMIKPFLTVESISFQGISFGGWSPGGGALAFSVVDKPDPESERLFQTLRFLNVNTGELCQYPDTYQGTMDIRPQIAWLPDGRILVVTDHNDVVLHTPCVDKATTISDAFPEPILSIAAQSPDNSTLLLRGQNAYWLFEAATQAVLQVEGLAPTTTEPYDVNRCDWSPSGSRVAISTPGSATYEAGSTVYLVNVQTGQVEQTIELDFAGEGSAPHPEWLVSDQLVIWVGSDSGPVQITLGPGTPQIVPIIPEIFGLDIKYPDDMEAIATVEDQVADTYHIVMALGSPDSNTVYLYHSETEAVEKLPHERTTFLFFPNGSWTRMPKRDWDNPAGAPGSVDEFQLVWVDSDQEARRLVVEGHIPRQYPDLNAVWLADTSQMIFSSSQGVSMVSIPDGALLDFWELEGYDGSAYPYLFVSPTGDVMLAVAPLSDPDGQLTGEGLYLIHVSR